LEGSGRSGIQDTVLEFARKDREHKEQVSIRINGLFHNRKFSEFWSKKNPETHIEAF
jgi:hypothetical protein